MPASGKLSLKRIRLHLARANSDLSFARHCTGASSRRSRPFGRHMPPVQRCKKVGLTVSDGGNQLAVDDENFVGSPKTAALTAGKRRLKSPPSRP